jgi:hypothetical protein
MRCHLACRAPLPHVACDATSGAMRSPRLPFAATLRAVRCRLTFPALPPLCRVLPCRVPCAATSGAVCCYLAWSAPPSHEVCAATSRAMRCHHACRALPPRLPCAAASRAVRHLLACRAPPPRVPCAAASLDVHCHLACRALWPRVPCAAGSPALRFHLACHAPQPHVPCNATLCDEYLASRALPALVASGCSRAVHYQLASPAPPPHSPCPCTSLVVRCHAAFRALPPRVPVHPVIPPPPTPPPPVHPLASQSFTMDVAVSLASELAGCGVQTDASASTVVSALHAALSSGGVDALLPCAAAVIPAHASASAAPSPPQPLFAVWPALASMEAGADVGRICLAAVSCWRTLQAEHTAHWCTGWEELLPEVDAAFLSTFGSANGHLLPHQLVPVAAAVLVATQPSASHSAGVN